MSDHPGAYVEWTRKDLPGRPDSLVAHLSDEKRGVWMTVAPEEGGEVTSMRVRAGNRLQELLYRACDYRTSDGWTGRAPLLWPAVGRCYSRAQVAQWRRTGIIPKRYSYDLGARTYTLPMHGFARFLPWKMTTMRYGKDFAWVRCVLNDSPATRRMYPFAFELTATHKLEKGEFVSQYGLYAGANARPMPFGIGNHITFRLPFTGRGRFEDCTVRTPAKQNLPLSKLSLLAGTTKPASLSRPTPVVSDSLCDGVFGGYKRGNAWVEVKDPSSFSARISQQEKPVGGRCRVAERDIFFVFFGNPKLKYYCPEPWMGRTNAFNTGRGAITLPAGEHFSWEMCIRIIGR